MATLTTFTTWAALYAAMLDAAARFFSGQMGAAEYEISTGGSSVSSSTAPLMNSGPVWPSSGKWPNSKLQAAPRSNQLPVAPMPKTAGVVDGECARSHRFRH
ncbi:MAG: hypothetical protein AB9919_06865 [Geobacteraceae bacterium]